LSPEASAEVKQYSVTHYTDARNNSEVKLPFGIESDEFNVKAAKEFYHCIIQMAFI
jgi:hypothetical protein